MENGTAAREGAREILDADALSRTVARLAHELIERNDDLARLALVGIHTRGVPLARRLQELVAERSGVELALGAVDISFHRDDVLVRGREAPLHTQPVVRGTELDFPLGGTTCVLVDDVLFTGRTIRAAIDALRADIVTVLLAGPTVQKWPARYFVRRTAWHVLDHVWEIEDRST